MKYLFVAEKPSLMREVKQCYERHRREIEQNVGQIDFIALAGHVCAFYEPNDYEGWDGRWDSLEYPLVPAKWGIKAIKDSSKQKILKQIKDNAPKYDGMIVGTDSDVEGYGIYFLLEHFLNLSKKRTLRFIEHSLTDKEILESLLSMTDYHRDPVHVHATQSYLLRAQADWLYGMNATRMLSNKMDTLMTIGRVKAPTLKLVYDNSKSIAEFQAIPYYNIGADYGDFQAVCQEKYPRKEDVLSLSIPLNGIVDSVERKETKTKAPKLYDLSALQSEAGQMLDLSPAEILNTVQSLYETHKVISYPRTQCRYVSSEKAKEFPDMLSKMTVFPDLAPYVERVTDYKSILKNRNVVNDVEVKKESHDALLPTSIRPNFSKMNELEIKICKLIYMRLLAQFPPELREYKTKLEILHGDKKFIAHGKVVADLGWRKLYGNLKERELPELKKGDVITAKAIQPVEVIPKAPKRLTQATLVDAMKNIAKYVEDKELKESLTESNGIGTPATRHAIINDLIKRGYIVDQKKAPKGLYITDSGKAYVENMQGIAILSPSFAAQMDFEIKKIQRGEANYTESYQNILRDLDMVCKQIESLQCTLPKSNYICPYCGRRLSEKRWDYSCECKLKIPKMIAGKQLSDKAIKLLLEGKKTPEYKFKKKNGETFQACLELTNEGVKFTKK